MHFTDLIDGKTDIDSIQVDLVCTKKNLKMKDEAVTLWTWPHTDGPMHQEEGQTDSSDSSASLSPALDRAPNQLLMADTFLGASAASEIMSDSHSRSDSVMTIKDQREQPIVSNINSSFVPTPLPATSHVALQPDQSQLLPGPRAQFGNNAFQTVIPNHTNAQPITCPSHHGFNVDLPPTTRHESQRNQLSFPPDVVSSNPQDGTVPSSDSFNSRAIGSNVPQIFPHLVVSDNSITAAMSQRAAFVPRENTNSLPPLPDANTLPPLRHFCYDSSSVAPGNQMGFGTYSVPPPFGGIVYVDPDTASIMGGGRAYSGNHFGFNDFHRQSPLYGNGKPTSPF